MAPTRLLSILSLTLITLLAMLSSSHVVRSNHGDLARRKSKRAKSKRLRRSLLAEVTTSTTSTTKGGDHHLPPRLLPPLPPLRPPQRQRPPPPPRPSSNSGSSNNSGGGVNLPGKACLAWPNGGANKLSSWKGSKTGLIYSWDANKVPGAEELGFTYAPMLWGWKDVDNFKAKVVEGYCQDCPRPNEDGQSSMDAWSGIQIWRQYMMPLASKGYTLISPAMSSRPNGKDWIATFMKNCGSDCCSTYVTYWHDTYNLPVYVTEYADQDFNGGPQASMDEIWAFMVGATEFMNANSWVKAHCWFGAMEGMDNVNPLNKLMNDAGDGPNDLGYYFINN
ncbi:glycosyl hydrolase catalytic core-domain-containing protein [Mycena vulgaris]|nr:glycosyl hydrolase catalytic core-domain-containing protein [Mycena vulgaris]